MSYIDVSPSLPGKVLTLFNKGAVSESSVTALSAPTPVFPLILILFYCYVKRYQLLSLLKSLCPVTGTKKILKDMRHHINVPTPPFSLLSAAFCC